MTTAIRKHLGDFLAVLALFVLAIGIGGYILSPGAAALPDRRGEAVRPQGRALGRPGGDPRPGSDGARGRREGRRHRLGRPRGRHGRRRAPDRAEVRGPAQAGRHRPAAHQDRPQGHVPRGRPGLGQADGGGRPHPVREHGARHRPGRGARGARLGHARLPQAADRRRGQGPQGPRHGPARDLPALRAAAPRPGARDHRDRQAPGRTSSAWCTTTACSPRSWPTTTRT